MKMPAEDDLDAVRLHEAAERMVAAWLRRRFGDDPQIEPLASRLAELPDDDRIVKISAATSLNDLAEG